MAKTTKVVQVSDIHTDTTLIPRKRHVIDPADKGSGMAVFSDKTYEPRFAQPRIKKQDTVLDTWSNTAMVLADRAKRASQTYGKKDFNALYRLVLSAGIAYDKAWPTTQAPLATNLIVNLFGSLGSEVTRAILEPPRPMLDITPLAGTLSNGEPPAKGGELEPTPQPIVVDQDEPTT